MKNVIICFLLLFVYHNNVHAQSPSAPSSIYSVQLKDIDDNKVQLASYSGKKILFIELPFMKADSMKLILDSFLVKHVSNVVVIGIVSAQNGYTDSLKAIFKSKYNVTGLILTEPMNCRKPLDQSTLMRFLTDKTMNGAIGMASRGAGHKYFVTETGKLIAVFPPKVRLSNATIERLMNTGKPNS